MAQAGSKKGEKNGEWKKPEWSLDAKSVAPLPTYDSADDKHNAYLLGACYAASPYQAARDATRSGYRDDLVRVPRVQHLPQHPVSSHFYSGGTVLPSTGTLCKTEPGQCAPAKAAGAVALAGGSIGVSIEEVVDVADALVSLVAVAVVSGVAGASDAGAGVVIGRAVAAVDAAADGVAPSAPASKGTGTGAAVAALVAAALVALVTADALESVVLFFFFRVERRRGRVVAVTALVAVQAAGSPSRSDGRGR